MPDRGGELAGDLDAGDLGATLFAAATLGALVVMPITRVVRGVDGGFDQRPAQIAGAVLGEGPRQSDSPDWSTLGHSPV